MKDSKIIIFLLLNILLLAGCHNTINDSAISANNIETYSGFDSIPVDEKLVYYIYDNTLLFFDENGSVSSSINIESIYDKISSSLCSVQFCSTSYLEKNNVIFFLAKDSVDSLSYSIYELSLESNTYRSIYSLPNDSKLKNYELLSDSIYIEQYNPSTNEYSIIKCSEADGTYSYQLVHSDLLDLFNAKNSFTYEYCLRFYPSFSSIYRYEYMYIYDDESHFTIYNSNLTPSTTINGILYEAFDDGFVYISQEGHASSLFYYNLIDNTQTPINIPYDNFLSQLYMCEKSNNLVYFLAHNNNFIPTAQSDIFSIYTYDLYNNSLSMLYTFITPSGHTEDNFHDMFYPVSDDYSFYYWKLIGNDITLTKVQQSEDSIVEEPTNIVGHSYVDYSLYGTVTSEDFFISSDLADNTEYSSETIHYYIETFQLNDNYSHCDNINLILDHKRTELSSQASKHSASDNINVISDISYYISYIYIYDNRYLSVAYKQQNDNYVYGVGSDFGLDTYLFDLENDSVVSVQDICSTDTQILKQKVAQELYNKYSDFYSLEQITSMLDDIEINNITLHDDCIEFIFTSTSLGFSTIDKYIYITIPYSELDFCI